MDKLDQYINGIEHLPPAPTVMVELLGLFKEEDRDLERVIELLSHDPALTAEILKRCNSAFFSGDSPAEDIFEAVSRLGFYEIYRIVTALFGARALSTGSKAPGLDIGKVWEHSVTCAVASATLAKRLDDDLGALAFTAGLLHDVGKVILVQAEAGYTDLVHTSDCRGQLFVEAERQQFGVDHAQLGARLLERWKLPENVVTAVRHHHHLSGAEPFQQLAATIHLANALAYRISDHSSADAPLHVSAYAMTLVKLKHEDVDGLFAEIKVEMEHAPDLAMA